MLTTMIGNKIQEMMENLNPKKKLSYVKAFLLGGLYGLIDFFGALGIVFWLICCCAAWVNRHGNTEDED